MLLHIVLLGFLFFGVNADKLQTPILRDIRVVLSDRSMSDDSNLITEINGKSADINDGFGGSYISLVAEWTNFKSKGATGIEVIIQNDKDINYEDMASGTGGKYRYLKMLRDSKSNNRITEVSLFRSKSKNGFMEADDSPIKQGWSAMTGDLNEDRFGDFLWLGYRTITIAA